MTWVGNSPPSFQQGLLQFLQSPMALGLSAGLLSSAQPSLTQPQSWAGGLSKGLLYGQQMTDQDRQRKVDEGRLGVEQGKLGVEVSKLQRELERYNQFGQIFNQTGEENPSTPNLLKGLNIGGGATPNGPGMLGNSIVPQQGAFTDTTPQQPQIPYVSKDTQLVTIQHPDINGGKPSNVPATMHGRKLNREEAVGNALAEQMAGKEHPVFTSWDEAAQALKAPQGGTNIAQAQPENGLLSQNAASPLPQAMPSAPPPVAQIPQAPAPRASGGGKSPGGGGGDDDLVTVTLPDGNQIQVPKEDFIRAKLLWQAGKPEEAAKALTAGADRTNLEKNLKLTGLKRGTPEYQEAALRNITKPAAEINLGEKGQELEQKARIARDNDMLKLSREGAPAGRAGSKLARENYELATRLMKRGFDPHRYKFTGQETRAEITSLLGGKASSQDISDFEVLNKNAIRLQLEMIKGLPARGLNQFQEKQIAQASGAGVTMPSTQRISIGLLHDTVEKQFADDFFTQYKAKYGDLDGALTAYNTWMDTLPELKFKKDGKGFDFVDDRKIERDMANWIAKPGTQEYIQSRLKHIQNKDPRFATEEELEFMAGYG